MKNAEPSEKTRTVLWSGRDWVVLVTALITAIPVILLTILGVEMVQELYFHFGAGTGFVFAAGLWFIELLIAIIFSIMAAVSKSKVMKAIGKGMSIGLLVGLISIVIGCIAILR